jgi:radical SAM superfamily enzyme YgiQ (UPF0313 family)
MRKVLLVQLPIPPFGIEPVRGNVPLAAGYLMLHARNAGMERQYDIEIMPPVEANRWGDLALVDAILSRDPWMVGFTCYLWNIQRTLWVCERLKERSPELVIVLGGPEITSDNEWVLRHQAIDYAAIGEGEQTFVEILDALTTGERPAQPIDGLYVASAARTITSEMPHWPLPAFRQPIARLDDVSSPYLAGILDAADEEMLLLETIRGCIFKCKFCYYPKSYDALYFLSEEKIVANLRHASERGAREVVLLDPTLNQKRDFAAFLRLLARCNPDRQFTYFGELRAEGINAEMARLMREANFTDVEIGLQSVDPRAMQLMDRRNNLRAFERGVRALLDAGIRVKVDLIIGLPGDTVDSVRRGMEYVRESGLYSEVQVFNLAVLPGTAFRHEAAELGLVYQDRPPYYVLETPTMDFAQMYELMDAAQEMFQTEFDPLPDVEGSGFDSAALATGRVPVSGNGLVTAAVIDFDQEGAAERATKDLKEIATRQAQAFNLVLQSSDFRRDCRTACEAVQALLTNNPHTTLQITLEPRGSYEHLTGTTLEEIRRISMESLSYLDRFYAVLPGPPKGAKRIVIALGEENQPNNEWLDGIESFATIVRPASV